MPSKSAKQHRFMEMVAHDPKKAKQLGIAQSVGKEFVAADKGKKFGVGGSVYITQGGKGQINKQGMRDGTLYGYKKEVPDVMLKRKDIGLKTGGIPEVVNSQKAHHTLGGVPNMSVKKFAGLKGGGMAKHDDIAEDKKLIKKAFKMHDAQEHKGGKGTDLSKLKKGGQIKEARLEPAKMESVKTSAKRDGIAQRGRTKGKVV
jgi:hypothetical protein